MNIDQSIQAEKKRQQQEFYQRLLDGPKPAKAEPMAIAAFAAIGSLVKEKGKINFSK